MNTTTETTSRLYGENNTQITSLVAQLQIEDKETSSLPANSTTSMLKWERKLNDTKICYKMTTTMLGVNTNYKDKVLYLYIYSLVLQN